MTKATTLEERYEFFRRMLEEAGECECENCAKEQRTETEQGPCQT
jgi:hypothetical protein